ncbi:MAG: hypothetical protein B7Z37_21000 [Verrucomicrobia bacterium 12-59-8]|nr:MAG: hypothetical protein B7Z37_21000 [Verrucomicrobia bacterium 12-59-8]
MTGNIRVLDAEYAGMCGHIEFELNFHPYGRYCLRCGDGFRLTNLDTGEEKRVNPDDILRLIRQGDDAMWDWQKFMGMWIGFAAGMEVGRKQKR